MRRQNDILVTETKLKIYGQFIPGRNEADQFRSNDQQQTCAAQRPMSAKGQKRTLRDLLDHFVGTALQRLRHGNAKRLGGLEIDDQLDFRQLLDWQVCWLLAF